METVLRLLQLIHKVVHDNLLFYDVFLHMNTHVGIQKILVTTIQSAKEVHQFIENIKAEPFPLEERFNSPASLPLETYEIPMAIDAYTSPQASLKAILDREKVLLELLLLLQSLSRWDPWTQHIKTLGEQIRKHIQLLKDRLDLEAMLSS